MDDYLRRLERDAEAGSTEDIRRLAYARLRAGACLEHGSIQCPQETCQVVLNIIRALDETDFLERWSTIEQVLYTYGLSHNTADHHLWDAWGGYHDLHGMLIQMSYHLGIFFPFLLADQFIEYYKLNTPPFCGINSIRLGSNNSRPGRTIVQQVDTDGLGWETLIGSIYYPDSFTSFLETLDHRINDKISENLPPLEIELILKKLPYVEANIAADLLEKGRIALFMGEVWCGEGRLSSGKNQPDWFRLGCKKYPDCYDPNICNDHLLYDSPGSVFAAGTSDFIEARVVLKSRKGARRQGGFYVKQEFNSELVTIIADPNQKYYSDLRHIIKKLRAEGFQVAIDNGHGKGKARKIYYQPRRNPYTQNPYPYIRNPWYDKALTGDLYRGTVTGPPRSFGVGVLGAGVYLSWDKRAAEGFAAIYADRYDAEPVTTTYRITPGLNILDKDSKDWASIMADLGLKPWDKIGGQFFSALLTRKAQERGYDGVISHDPYDGLVIFDSKNVLGYTDPTVCKECHKRKLQCEKCGHFWCHTTCDSEFEDCPNCSVCKKCGSAELDECYDCEQTYCTDCDDECPNC